MELKIVNRSKNQGTRALRRQGLIPAAIYHRGNPSEPISIEAAQLTTCLRQVVPGRLATTRFFLTVEGKKRPAIIKEIQYHPTTYNVLHVDFEELHDGVLINVKVPLEFAGSADCVGVKQGGFIRPVIRGIRVRCLPKDMPEFFSLDVAAMTMKETKRGKDIPIPSEVRPLVDLNEVVVVIAKK